MQKITLPLVMIASLVTLVSCGQTDNSTSNSPLVAPAVTGVVVTPTVSVQPVTTTGSAPVSTPVTTVNPVKPEVFTRTEVVTYQTPAGIDPVEFSVTITDGIITAAKATSKADNEISKKLQTAFAAEVSTKVVGKKAKNINLDAIGGASLTTNAFEQFVNSF